MWRNIAPFCYLYLSPQTFARSVLERHNLLIKQTCSLSSRARRISTHKSSRQRSGTTPRGLPFSSPDTSFTAATMTRRIVYGISLWVFLAGIFTQSSLQNKTLFFNPIRVTDTAPATALTMASIALPNWISYTSPSNTSPNPSHPNTPIHISYGLHVRCSSLTGQCTHFPTSSDCHGSDRYFCSMWRTVGFLMSFTVVLELATLVSFATVLIGGRANREGGWKMCSGFMGAVAAAQIVAMAIVVCRISYTPRM